jgi:hypothetical protein
LFFQIGIMDWLVSCPPLPFDDFIIFKPWVSKKFLKSRKEMFETLGIVIFKRQSVIQLPDDTN